MKFRAERGEFADAAAWALRTVGARATLPALSGVRLEVSGDRLVLSSTDLEMASELSIPVQAESDGVALVPGRLLGDVVRTLPNAAVSAEAAKERLHLACGRAQFDLRLMSAEDFPTLPEPGADAVTVVMKSEEFARTVAQVARAASADDARPVLTGVQLEATTHGLTASATDSYRLAVRTVPWDQGTERTVLVPRRALEEARRSAELLGSEVRLLLEAGQVTFAFSDRRLTSRLIEGKFPDVRQLIPAGSDRRLLVDRAALMEVAKRVAVVGDANTTATPVTLHLTADSVRVTAGSGEVGQAEESMPGQLEGEPLQIAFNPRYLTDGLDAAGSERVVLEFRDELKPAVLRPAPAAQDEDEPAAPDFLYLLMPVRV
ncbi:MAG: DNA polymerase III subunit beta [Actinomycetota bacterium]|nr:DNA polymerase III subunit beta [Euzebyales bacterium]MDQ3342002.1 DNA polymerase III subunit beta [Actinomycetota bacterium]MDQ3528664.1 DNA polymerase III subunit beta [Actinomycetota bacterium]